MECQHCKSTFKSASSLNYHQKTAKYCLKLRNQSNNALKCKFCDKSLSSKHWLTRHIPKCPKNVEIQQEYKELVENNNELKTVNNMLDFQNVELKKQIKELQEHLANIAKEAASRPTNVTNQNNKVQQIINSLQPVTTQHFIDSVDKLTMEHIKGGPDGYATYALEFPLKNRVACTDFARKKIKYKNEDGQLVTDPEMTTLMKKLFSAIQERNSQLIKEYAVEMQAKLWGLPDDGKEELNEKEAESLFEKMESIRVMLLPIMSQDRQVRELAQGARTELYFDVLRAVCSRCM
jgi:hypothetical protein